MPLRRDAQRHLQRRRSVGADQPRRASPASADNLATFRQYNALSGITVYDFRGESQLQLDAGDVEPPDGPTPPVASSPTPSASTAARSATSTRIDRSVRPEPHLRRRRRATARTCSTCRGTRSCPNGARGRWTTRSAAGCSNGWQLSGISSLASGIPDPSQLRRRRRQQRRSPPPTSAPPTSSGPGSAPAATALAPVYTCDPRSRRQQGWREDPRHQLHLACRRSARTAT